MSIVWEEDKFYVDEDFSVNHVKNAKPIRAHTHDFIEFTYMVRGRCVHKVDGREYPASKGDLLFINYGSTHSITSVVDCEYVDILLKPEFVDESLVGKENAFSLLGLNDFTEFEQVINRDKAMVHFSGDERARFEVIIALAEEEENGSNAGRLLITKSCMNIFLTNVFRKMAIPMNNFSGINEKLLKYIKENCALPLKMEEIAARCNYNPSYFSRIFKKYAGMTFTEYLNNVRLDYARKLLDETEMQIGDIISSCGYSDRSKFFKSFSKRFGVTPKKLRKK